MARIIAIANQKGGVGKTTTTINLGATLAVADMKVLIIDADPQGNSTSGLGLRGKARRSFYHALILNEPLSGMSLDTELPNLQIIPAEKTPRPPPRSRHSLFLTKPPQEELGQPESRRQKA